MDCVAITPPLPPDPTILRIHHKISRHFLTWSQQPCTPLSCKFYSHFLERQCPVIVLQWILLWFLVLFYSSVKISFQLLSATCFLLPSFTKFCLYIFVFADTETSEKIQKSGILQVFASLLTPQSSCTAKVANVIAEVAKNGEVFHKAFSAGTSSVLQLTCQYVLLHLCFHFVE